MRVLVLHNYYQQSGGEDRVFESETALLEAQGHEVIRVVGSNAEITGQSPIKVLCNALWNRSVADELRRLIKDHRPDIAHVHNVFSVLSPAVYHVLHNAGIPVVQTLHNYRLACPNARFMREGLDCTLCRGQTLAWPAIRYRCYQASFLSSIGMAATLTLHRLMKTWTRCVDLYMAPSNFVKHQMMASGLPASRIIMKPHFIADPGETSRQDRSYALFLGRLEQEKGILELINAWRHLPGFPLHIAGDGPLRSIIENKLKDPALGHVSLLGWMPRPEIETQLSHARFVVVPSLWKECFGLSAIEAFSYGIPVLASPNGSLPEIVQNRQNGFIVDPNNVSELVSRARSLYEDTPLWTKMAEGARKDYLSLYSPMIGYKALMDAYTLAIDNHAPHHSNR